MVLSKELHKLCPGCGTEAEGLEQVNKVFGYRIEADEIVPYPSCRACRSQEQARKLVQGGTDVITDSIEDIGWANASAWAKRIHTNRETFIRYLIHLEYLAVGAEGPLRLTEKGRLHSAITNRRFKETLLWDYDTFVEVMRCRAQKARVSFHCPRCRVDLEESAEFDYLQPSYRCHKCGKVYDYFNTKVVFDE